MEDHFYDIKMLEWEMGLPSLEDLTPLTQSLISPELALAFGITPQKNKFMFDLNQVFNENCSTVCPREDGYGFDQPLRLFPNGSGNGLKRGDSGGSHDESNNSMSRGEETGDESGGGGGGNRAVKRPRLVWTPQLHKRFVDVIEHLGIEKAVPKTIMEMMNVEGLTRENVASHLQKYRLYLKRMEGVSSEGQSTPRRGGASAMFEYEGFGPVPMHGQGQSQSQVVQQQQQQPVSPIPVVPLPSIGPPPGAYGFGHLGFPVGNSAMPGYCGLESGTYNMFWNRQRG